MDQVGDGAADTVFVNGSVYTVDAARRWAQATAIRRGRIVAVGTDADVTDLVSHRTNVIDLRGKMLLPGFQDAHIHASAGGLDQMRCDLTASHSRKEYAAIIRRYAEDHPDKEWILGAGWSQDAFPTGVPTRDQLDAIVPHKPAFLVNRDHHAAWANSKALELADITRDTPDPPDGRIERDESGTPVGTLQEGAMTILERIVPAPDLKERIQGILAAQAYLLSLGITAWQEAIVGDYPGIPDSLEAYRTLSERGELTARVVGALWWARDRGEEQIEDLLERRERGTFGRFRATSVKIMQDGVCENLSAAMLEPFMDAAGHTTTNLGTSYIDPETLKVYVTRLDREGFQVHFHAIGDRAVREVLDAVEASRQANGYTDHRHHVAHLQVVHPEDLTRFRTLNVAANAQPLWAQLDPQNVELTLPILGPERYGWQYPIGSLVRNGAMLAYGSDWPVSSPDPIGELHVAVNHTPPPGYEPGSTGGDGPEVFLPDERVDLPTAIASFTMGSAYVNHLDGETGSIEPGKLADLAVLDQNLFKFPRSEIGTARNLLTMVGGEVAFADPSFVA